MIITLERVDLTDINGLGEEIVLTFASKSKFVRICNTEAPFDVVLEKSAADGDGWVTTVLKGCSIKSIFFNKISLIVNDLRYYNNWEYRKYKISQLDL
jgi:hypothetical protein